MVSYSINTDKKSDRPLICLGNSLIAMVDTGATVPVWVGNNDSFLIEKLHAVLIKDSVDLIGFGGSDKCKAYKIPSITVSDITFKNVPILLSEKFKTSAFNVILSASMFSGMIYQFDTINNKMRLYIPDNETERVFSVRDSNGKQHAFVMFNIDKYIDEDIIESKIEIVGMGNDAHKSYAAALKNHNDNTYGDTTPK